MHAASPTTTADHLSAAFPIEFVTTAGSGRGLVAARPIAAGEVVLASAAAAAVPLDVAERCASCFQRPPQAASAGSGRPPQLLRCGGCKGVRYCNAECQREDWRSNHKRECRTFPLLVANPDHVLVHNALLLGRLTRMTATPAEERVSGGEPNILFPSISDVIDMERDPEEARAAEWGATTSLARAAGLLGPALPAEELGGVVSAFDRNNFAIFDDLMTTRAAACFPIGALLNHSCVPSCVLSYKRMRIDGVTHHVQEVRALTDLPAGAELTHAYVELARPRAERRARLLATYGFVCECRMCEPPPDAPDPDSARGLLARNDGGVLPSYLSPSFLSPEDAASAAEFPADMDPQAVRDVKVGRSLGKLVEVGGKGIEPALLKSLQCEEEVTEFAYVPCRGAVCELDAAEQALLRLELSCLEVALSRLQRHLRPTHLDVHAVVNMALHRYLLMEDKVAALLACERVVSFYRSAYSCSPGHPMLGLQLFTLADVFSEVHQAVSSFVDRPRPASALGVSPAQAPALHSKARTERLAGLYALLPPAAQAGGTSVNEPGSGEHPKSCFEWDWSAPVSAATQAWLQARAAGAYEEAISILRVSHGADHSMVAAAKERLSNLRGDSLKKMP